MNGWTGTVFSAWRAALALALAVLFAAHLPALAAHAPAALALPVLGFGAALALLVGRGGRATPTALVLLLAALLAVQASRGGPRLATLLLVGFTALHGLAPSAPFGSWPARERTDPAGAWRLPAHVVWLARALLAAHLAALLLVPEVDGVGASLALLPLHALALDPGWLPARPSAADERDPPPVLFYDGGCGVCHGAVRVLLAEDRAGRLRFAPLDSETLRERVDATRRAALPDSLVLLLPDDTLLTRSAALIAVGRRLGGVWRALADLAALLPARLRDAAYDAFARRRARFAAAPEAACPLMPPELGERFLA